MPKSGADSAPSFGRRNAVNDARHNKTANKPEQRGLVAGALVLALGSVVRAALKPRPVRTSRDDGGSDGGDTSDSGGGDGGGD